jgi:hypothetical protein
MSEDRVFNGPMDVYHALFEEVGYDNRKVIFQTIDESMGDSVMQYGTVKDGYDHLVTKVKAKLGTDKPAPWPRSGSKLDNGAHFEDHIAPRQDGGLSEVIKARRAARRGY